MLRGALGSTAQTSALCLEARPLVSPWRPNDASQNAFFQRFNAIDRREEQDFLLQIRDEKRQVQDLGEPRSRKPQPARRLGRRAVTDSSPSQRPKEAENPRGRCERKSAQE